MKPNIFFACFLLSSAVFASDPQIKNLPTLLQLDIVTEIDPGHVSPFCPTIERSSGFRVTLPNMHEVLTSSPNHVRVLRGNSPFSSLHIEEILEQGVGQVIVYKSFSKSSAKKQLESLYRDNGYQGDLTFLPLEWRADKNGFYDEVKACKLTLRALEIIKTSQAPVFFHCTVGEDRTGLLAGLTRLVFDNWSVEKAFSDEMCARGYEAGNPFKSQSTGVVEAIRENLTPLFLKMAFVLKKTSWTEKDCESLPQVKDTGFDVATFTCKPVEDSHKICSQD